MHLSAMAVIARYARARGRVVFVAAKRTRRPRMPWEGPSPVDLVEPTGEEPTEPG